MYEGREVVSVCTDWNARKKKKIQFPVAPIYFKTSDRSLFALLGNRILTNTRFCSEFPRFPP